MCCSIEGTPADGGHPAGRRRAEAGRHPGGHRATNGYVCFFVRHEMCVEKEDAERGSPTKRCPNTPCFVLPDPPASVFR